MLSKYSALSSANKYTVLSAIPILFDKLSKKITYIKCNPMYIYNKLSDWQSTIQR